MNADPRILILLEPASTQSIVAPDLLARLERLAHVTAIKAPHALLPSQLASLLGSHDIAITGWGTPCLPAEIAADPNSRLRYICNMTGSIRAIIPPNYLKGSTVITNWGNTMSPFVAEAALTMILACCRRIKYHGMILDRRLKSNAPPGQKQSLVRRLKNCIKDRVHQEWQQAGEVPGFTLFEASVGFYGLGHTAKELARLLSPFDVKLRYFDPYAVNDTPYSMEKVADLKELFRTCEVVSIHAGPTAETENTVNWTVLDCLPREAILINTARGRIINERDLLAALEEKKLWVGLDVFAKEPMPRRSPLRRHPRVVATPHTAGLVGDKLAQLLSNLVIENVSSFISEKNLKFVVTQELYNRMT